MLNWNFIGIAGGNKLYTHLRFDEPPSADIDVFYKALVGEPLPIFPISSMDCSVDHQVTEFMYPRETKHFASITIYCDGYDWTDMDTERLTVHGTFYFIGDGYYTKFHGCLYNVTFQDFYNTMDTKLWKAIIELRVDLNSKEIVEWQGK